MHHPLEVAYIVTGNNISVTLNNRFRCIPLNTEQGQKLLIAVKKRPQDIDEIGEIAEVTTFITRHTFGRVTVDDRDQLRLDGYVVDFGLSKIIIRMVQDGDDVSHLTRFLENVATNPDPNIAEHVYAFLSKGGMPITPDGCFHAFKKVDNDFMSFASGKEDVTVTLHKTEYTVGSAIWEIEPKGGTFKGHVPYYPDTTLEMDRALCDPQREQTCSVGLHACSPGYLNHWYGQKGRLMIVKINPRDVTAVPNDYDDAKLRCCRLDVLAEIPEEEAKGHFDRVVEHRYTPTPVIDDTKDGETTNTEIHFPISVSWSDGKIEDIDVTGTVECTFELSDADWEALMASIMEAPDFEHELDALTAEFDPTTDNFGDGPTPFDLTFEDAIEMGVADGQLHAEEDCNYDPYQLGDDDSVAELPEELHNAYRIAYAISYMLSYELDPTFDPKVQRRGFRSGKRQARLDLKRSPTFAPEPANYPEGSEHDEDAFLLNFMLGYLTTYCANESEILGMIGTRVNVSKLLEL